MCLSDTVLVSVWVSAVHTWVYTVSLGFLIIDKCQKGCACNVPLIMFSAACLIIFLGVHIRPHPRRFLSNHPHTFPDGLYLERDRSYDCTRMSEAASCHDG